MASNLDPVWTRSRIEALKVDWLEGLSASEIARRLGGGITRNAVIGKIHRLGLSERRVPKLPPEGRPARAPTVPRQTYAKPPKPGPQGKPAIVFGNCTPAPTKSAHGRVYVMPESRPLPVEAPVDGPVVALADLTPGACRWPVGDPAHPSFGFCGRKAIDPCPYCTEHAGMAYQPGSALDADKAAMRTVERLVERAAA